MLARRRHEARDTVCEKRASQAYVDPASVQPLSVLLEEARLSSSDRAT